MLKLILGVAGSGKTSRILSDITENAAQGVTGQYLIVPEQYSHEAERELLAAGGDEICLHAEVLSFSRLALRVAQIAGNGGRTSLDKAGRLMCMSLALDKVSPFLRLYSSAARKPELQSGLFAAVEELKSAQIPSSALEAASSAAGGMLSAKLHDLSLCLEAYNAVMAQGRADPTDRLLRLAETVCDAPVAGSKIYIDGFTDFTGAELLVIQALIKSGAELTVCLTCDGVDGAGEQFEPARKAAFTLLRLAKDAGVSTDIETLSGSDRAPAMSFFSEHLFAYTSNTMQADDSIFLVKCQSVRQECEMAAARCIELVRDRGCRWRDIAVAVRGFGDYAAPLEDVFSLYDVPLISATRESILQKSVPSAISAAFEVVLGGWALPDVLAYLKTGLTGLSRQEGDELECYAVLWNLRGSFWYRESGFTAHPAGFGADWDDESREKLKRINSARSRLCAPLFRLAKRGQAAVTALDQAQALADFLSESALAENLARHADELDSAGLAQLAAETGQLWEIIVRALEQFADILGKTPMTQSEFARLFARALSQYDVSAIPSSPDSVSAGEVDRMRRRHIKHLIFLGASDDRIPAVADSGGILSEDERDELRGLGVDLGGGDDRLKREFSLIYNCVTLPEETLTLSYCTTDSNGAASRPSFLIKRASMLFDSEPRSFELRRARLCAESSLLLLAAGGDVAARAYFKSSDAELARLADLEKRLSSGLGELSPDNAESLYGKTKNLSPSQAESLAQCRLSYFLRYGLRLDERETAGFTPPELGTFMHYVLENTIKAVTAGVGFDKIGDGEVCSIADGFTDKYIAERLGGFEDKSARFIHLFERMRPSVRRITLDTVHELSHSDFRPLDFELKFMRDGDLPPIEIAGAAARIVGIADRVDGFVSDGKLYVRVIDYKTGKKSFSLSDVWNGIGLQMLIYLFALEKEGRERYGKQIVPAGVLYVPAKDITVSAAGDLSDDKLTKQRAKNLRRSGLLLSDESILSSMEHGVPGVYLPVSRKKDGSLGKDALASAAQLSQLSDFVSEKLTELVCELSGGAVEAKPCYRTESDNACRFCPYDKVCRFDEASGQRRYLTKIKPEEFWARLGGERHE